MIDSKKVKKDLVMEEREGEEGEALALGFHSS